MASLSDFNQQKASPKLSDFFAGTKKAAPVVNQDTINNIAAHTAALSQPEQMEQNYSQVNDDLQYGPTSPTMDKVTAAWDSFDYGRNVEQVEQILQSDEYSIEQKEAAVTTLMGTNPPTSIYRRVAEASIIADSEPDDNDEVEFTRVQTAPLLDEVDVYNGMVQQQINQINNAHDPSVMNTLKDFVEVMVPFFEQANMADLATEVAGATGENQAGAIMQALTAMGESKVGIRAIIQKMPIEQRTKVAQLVVDYIQKSSGSQGLVPNRFVSVNQLTNMLATGGYTGTDRFIDNLTSAIDDTIIFSPLSRLAGAPLRAIGGALNGVGAARAGAASIKRYEAAIANLSQADLVGRVEKALEDTSTALSNTTASGVKNGIVDAAGEVITESIMKSLPEDLPPSIRTDITNTISNKMGEFIPGGDVGQLTGDLLNEIKAAISKRIVAGQATEAAPRVTDELLQIEFKPEARSFSVDIDNAIDALPTDMTKAEIDNLRSIISEEVYNPNGMSIDKIIDSTPSLDQLTSAQINDFRQTLGNIRTRASTRVESVSAEAAIFRSDATREATKSSVSPTSVGRVYQETNPAKLRATMQSVIDDDTGRLAQAVFGTNRTEAIASETLPEVAKVRGNVRQKVSVDEVVGPRPNQSIIDRVQETRGDIQYTPTEKERLRASVKDDWRDVVGLVPRTEMSTVEDISTGARMNMVYGPKDGGFKSAQQALDQAKFALRKYGVQEDEISILTRDASGYRPMTKNDKWDADGNYLIQVKYDYEFSPTDIRNFDNLKGSWWKFADIRIPGTTGKAGGFTQHLIPSSTIINSALTNAASVASDFSAFVSRRLLELGKEYADLYKALPKEQKYLLDSYILEANEKGLKFNPARLEARGMSPKTVEAARKWKENWDTIYHFENADSNKTLRNLGYEKFVDQSNNTDLIVKPLPRNQVAGDVRAWDAENGGRVVKLSRQEITKLYEGGGSIARARSALEVEDDVIEMVVVKNNTGSYTRRLREDDYTLSYRDGYYTVRYDSPFFITKKMRNKDGQEFEKAIATSANRVDAERELARLRTTDEAGEYDFRQGRDAEDRGNLEWSAAVNTGRTSQKVRGERLKDVSNTSPDLNFKHMETPEESLVRSIQSVANRTAFRGFLDTSKARWMKQFGHLTDRKMWPEDARVIGRGSASHSRTDLADAITTWRYIDSVESGYVDMLDDVTKSFFKGISDVSGRAGWKHIEEVSRKAEQFDINNFARRKAFRLLLSSNPVRQVLVQASQAFPVILAQNPTFLLTGRLPAQMALVSYMKSGGDISSFFKGMAKTGTGLSVDEAATMIKHYRDSGIEDFVSAHTYMRENMASLVNRKMTSKAAAIAGKPLDFTQKIGFELGENTLMSSIWLSEYDKLRRLGKPINREVLDNLNAKVRNLTGNMNRAGEMPYNQNVLSGIMQFFGTPHKIFAQVFMGHTGLTGVERARLAAAYTLTYGTGAGFITDAVLRMLPANTDAAVRDTVENGLANLGLNKMLSTIYGEEVDVAFTESFRIGVEQPNVFQFFEDLMALNLPAIIAGSPSGAYMFGDNPKFNAFVHSLMRPFTVSDERRPQEILETGKAFLNMFSGASNFMKAKYILEHGKKLGGTGRQVGDDLNPIYALMQIAGFSSMDEVRSYALQDKIYKQSSQPYDDVKGLVTEVSRRLAIEGIGNTEIEYWMRVMAEAQIAWGNDVFMNNILMDELKTRTRDGDTVVWDSLLRMSNYVDENAYEDMLRTSNLPVETVDALREAARIIRESR